MPRSPVDNYRITYVPFEGGKRIEQLEAGRVLVGLVILRCLTRSLYDLSSTGSPMMVTVDGSVFEALLSDMIPGKMYQVTVSSVKGLEESDPSTDTVTTGELSSRLT